MSNVHAGAKGTATAGDYGTATAGEGGTIIIRYCQILPAEAGELVPGLRV